MQARLGPCDIAHIAPGVMGDVYRSRWPSKCPEAFARNPERMRRFLVEAKLAGSLNHPNILVAHDNWRRLG